MNTLYFVQGIPTSYATPDLFVFGTKAEAEKGKKEICDFYDNMSFDYEYELKEVDITNLNIKDNVLYCVVGAVTPREIQTWIFDTKDAAETKEQELWDDPDRFNDATFYTTEIYLDNLETITIIKEYLDEQKEYYEEYDEEEYDD